MDITLIDLNKLKIHLTKEDLKELPFELSENTSEDILRGILNDLLNIAKFETGFAPKLSKLRVEIYPSRDDGYVIYFSVLNDCEKPDNGLEPVVFMFGTFDLLLDCIIKFKDLYMHRVYKSSLYKLEDTYRLIIYPLDYSDNRSRSFLSEYGELVGQGHFYAAFIEEHGHEIIKDNAIEKIAGVFK